MIVEGGAELLLDMKFQTWPEITNCVWWWGGGAQYDVELILVYAY